MRVVESLVVVSLGAVQEYGGEAAAGGAVVLGLLFMVLWLLGFVLAFAGMWKTFEKAGKPGWAVLVPIYNVVVLLEIAGKPVWWILLLFVPLVNLVVAILVTVALAERFGKGAGFGIGLLVLPFVFYPVLGFGDATYRG